MFFNSYEFVLLFLPLSICIYYLLGHYKKYTMSNIFLLLASLYFYARFNWKFIPFITVSILMNYTIGYLLQKNKNKTILILGIFLNLCLLGYCKYTNFFIENINTVMSTDFTLLNILIPIGISFFTFQQLSFIIDTYKNPRIHYPLLEYTLHIVFFIYIISGPIVRHNQIIPQLLDKERKQFKAEQLSKGFMAFIIGLAKKVIIADTFAIAANWGFTNVPELNATSGLFVMLAYTLQIYFDFSGYSDMVTGIGAMLNLDIPQNFDSPYKAISMIDFWKRWHISLTKFFTDYIYIPLGGSHKGTVRTYINVFIVFLLSGIWHGANWTFIIWGCMHGILNILNRIFKKNLATQNTVLGWLLTFLAVNVAWIFFRAENVMDALSIIKTICTFQFGILPADFMNAFMLPEFRVILSMLGLQIDSISAMITVAFFAINMVIILQAKNVQERMMSFKPSAVYATQLSLLFIWSILSFSTVTTFVYVNF